MLGRRLPATTGTPSMTTLPQGNQHVFAGLAESRGVTIRMCEAAAKHDRLADVLRLPYAPGYADRRQGALSGAQAQLALQARRWGP